MFSRFIMNIKLGINIVGMNKKLGINIARIESIKHFDATERKK